MKGTIIFTREALNKLKIKCQEAKDNNHSSFVWKANLMSISEAESLINKLEASRNLSIPYCSCN